MPAVLIAVLGYVVSGLVFRVLASISVSLFAAAYIRAKVNEYLDNAYVAANSAIPPDVSALLNLARADEVLSIITGAIMFAAFMKSLKLIFVRK